MSRRKSAKVPHLSTVGSYVSVSVMETNDSTDLLTPLSFAGGSTNVFPDKERSTSTLGSQPMTSSFTFSEMANSRGLQRSRSFKVPPSRSNSFNSFMGPPTSRSLSRQNSMDSVNSSRETPSGSKTLKIFVKLPSNSLSGDDSELSHDEIDLLQMEAERESKGDSDTENRPPSPRPRTIGVAVRLHSEVLENWEDSMRFRIEANPANAKYHRCPGSQTQQDEFF